MRKALLFSLLVLATSPVAAQSFRIQCPPATALHPLVNGGQPNPGIKCQQIAGGDGFATMGDGTQTYLFAFGPLSGLVDIANGLPGTLTPSAFNLVDPGDLQVGDPATTILGGGSFTFNGAVGLVGDPEGGSGTGAVAHATIDSTTGGVTGVVIDHPGAGYTTTPVVLLQAAPQGAGFGSGATAHAVVSGGAIGAIVIDNPGTGYELAPEVILLGPDRGALTGHVDARPIMDVGIMNGNLPAPMMAIDEDDEFFLTLTNVGMIMRPDLFEQHTVHFHGYPNASSFYDGVPDASVAINIGGSFTYYYLAPEAGTYFWHCHITPPEHLQMGMVGQIYVRPRQNRVNGNLRDALIASNRSANGINATTDGLYCTDVLCASQTPVPALNGATNNGTFKYAYNDGDGSTRYDVEYPLQIHGFDPNFHFVGMTFNPEPFTDQKDKYFLLNGRSYPDTMTAGPMATQATDGTQHFAQPLPSIINIPPFDPATQTGGRALLRLSSLDTMEYQTLASLGIPMRVIALNARLLRDMAGNDMTYLTNSITLGGGESLDVILDASDPALYPRGSHFYLYTPNLDHLSNDAENFGGLMTEVCVGQFQPDPSDANKLVCN